MSNRYYLVTADKVEQARTLAPAEGLPSELFSTRWNHDKSKAIVQANWTDDMAMDTLGTDLGERQADGYAPQAVYDELTKPEWQAE